MPEVDPDWSTGQDWQACLVCGREAEVECAACGAPLCDDCAHRRDHDPYCPGGKCLL